MNIYNDNGDLTDEAIHIISQTIDACAGRLKFGYHTKEDIFQQNWIFVLTQLWRYDGKRSLGAFVSRVMHTRTFNYKRDTYHRPQKPCIKCPLWERAGDKCLGFKEKSECEKYEKWRLLNESKRNLHHFAPMECAAGIAQEERSNELMDNSDILGVLRISLSAQENELVDKYLMGEKITKKEFLCIVARLREIYDENEDN